MKVIEKKNLLPFALVTVLFLLWGLANNMTDTLLAAFKRIMDMTDTQTSFIQMAFYGAYFCLALPAAIFIRRFSFKSGILVGLGLYAAGAMLFLPAAWTESYAFYLIAIYIMASGCSFLETTANPYIMSMGAPETATRRLNIAQSFNPVGSILGIVASKYFILSDISLNSISGTYAGLGCVLLVILFTMLFAKMPQGRDEGVQTSGTFGRLVANKTYLLGVIAQFFYVGAQLGVWSFTIRLVMQETGMVEAQASNIYLLSIVGFCASRFIYTGLMKWFAPAKLLVFGGIMSAAATLVVVLGAGTGAVLIIALVLISMFMSLMFPTIYGLALGSIATGSNPDDVKIAASGLIMAILGGALMTPLQGVISDAAGIYTAFLVPAFCFAVVTLYGIFNIRTKKNQ